MELEKIEDQNATLRETSKMLFGDTARLQIVDPKSLKLLKENARFFKKSTFKQLTENVKKDKRLSSVPLCHEVGNSLEVLSGNHRVQAAVEAGLDMILVMVLQGNLEKNDKLSIQLSHNSLVGEDDKQILANLWSQIEDINAKCYAGLSSDQIGDLQKVKLVNFSTPTIRTKQISFAFTVSEFEAVQETIDELQSVPGDIVYLAELSEFDDFFQALQQVKKSQNIKNGALALRRLIEIASELPENPIINTEVGEEA